MEQGIRHKYAIPSYSNKGNFIIFFSNQFSIAEFTYLDVLFIGVFPNRQAASLPGRFKLDILGFRRSHKEESIPNFECIQNLE